DQCGARVLLEALFTCGRLDDGTIGAQVSAQHSQGTFVVNRVGERPDDVIVVDRRILNGFPKRLAHDCQAVDIQCFTQPGHQAQQATCVEKIFHQIGGAGGADVGNDGNVTAECVEVVQRPLHASAARHGQQVNHCVGGTAGCHGHDGRIAYGALGDDLTGAEVFPHHFHRTTAAGGGHADVVGIGGRDGGCSGNSQ